MEEPKSLTFRNLLCLTIRKTFFATRAVTLMIMFRLEKEQKFGIFAIFCPGRLLVKSAHWAKM